MDIINTKTWAHKAPHAVTDPAKLTRMIETLNSGGALPSVLWDGNQAYEGSHRLAAWEAAEQDADLILVTNDDLARAARLCISSASQTLQMVWTSGPITLAEFALTIKGGYHEH